MHRRFRRSVIYSPVCLLFSRNTGIFRTFSRLWSQVSLQFRLRREQGVSRTSAYWEVPCVQPAKAAVRATVTNYIEAYYTGDAHRIET